MIKLHSLVAIAIRIFILICVFFQYANAGLVKRDLFVPGDGLIIWDTVTNLEWLYLDATAGRSIESLINGTDGPDYIGEHGFNFAQQEQLQSLWAAENVPLSTSGYSSDPIYVAGVTKLIQLLGTPSPLYSGSNVVGEMLSGFYNVNTSSCSEGFHQYAELSRIDSGTWAGTVVSNAFSPCYNNDLTGTSKGKYLVKTGPNNSFPWEIFMPAILNGANKK